MYRWLGLFGRKATPESTNAYRTAAVVVDDAFAIQLPATDDDVEAPPVMVRVDAPTIGPNELPLVVKGVMVIVGISATLMACIVIFGSRH